MNMNRVFPCIVLLSIGFVAALPALSRVATAQAPRPAAPATNRPAQASGADGNWVNVDAKTRNLARITIEGMSVHPFGACSPTPCDWGVLPAKSSTTQAGTVRRAALVAVHTTKAEQNTLTIVVDPDGRLSVNVLTHFTDNSGRKDYNVVNTMTRATPHSQP
jgi:hypothetical protein